MGDGQVKSVLRRNTTRRQRYGRGPGLTVGLAEDQLPMSAQRLVERWL